MTPASTPRRRAIVCGTSFGRFYLRALANNPAIELVGILSSGSAASAGYARELNIAHYTSVASLPADIDLACVVVRAAVSGGKGAEIACQLLSRGIHVLQEHPLHPDELADCLRAAHQHRVRFGINAFYPFVAPIRRFLEAAEILRQRQPVQYIEGVCGAQVLYPLLDVIARALGKLRPAQLALMEPRQVGPYTCLHGSIGGVPLTLRVQNQIHPADADNHALLLHRLTITAESGVLALADTHGPAIWSPRLHTHRDETHRLVLEGEGTERLSAASSTLLPGSEAVGFSEIFERLWPQAINCAVADFERSIDAPALAQQQVQWALGVTGFWHRVSSVLGPPELIYPDTPAILPLIDRLPEETPR